MHILSFGEEIDFGDKELFDKKDCFFCLSSYTNCLVDMPSRYDMQASSIVNNFRKMLNRLGVFWVGIVCVFIVINCYFLTKVLVVTWSNTDPAIVTTEGFIRGGDFIALWPALYLAVNGKAELAYDKNAVRSVQEQLTGIDSWADRRFLHPPTYMFILFPLGELPYFTALAIWVLFPLTVFFFIIARMGIPWVLFSLIPFSGAVVQNIASGQNGSLSALFLAGGLWSLNRRPYVAGILFGLMTCKPQLALLIVPALVIGRRWRALIALVVTVVIGIGMSIGAFGIEPWIAFFRNLIFAQQQLALGHLPWHRIPSAFVAARMAGLDTIPAQIFQGVVALGAFFGVAWAWWKPICFHLKAAVLAAAIPLTTPWIHDYDLIILIIPMAWLILDNKRAPIHSVERAILILVWMFPVVWIAQLLPMQGIPYGFVLLIAFYGIIMIRIFRYGSSAQDVDAKDASARTGTASYLGSG